MELSTATGVLFLTEMDEKDFKKHLRDLAHGQHHPEEHDWPSAPARQSAAPGGRPRKRAAARKSAPKKK